MFLKTIQTLYPPHEIGAIHVGASLHPRLESLSKCREVELARTNATLVVLYAKNLDAVQILEIVGKPSRQNINLVLHRHGALAGVE